MQFIIESQCYDQLQRNPETGLLQLHPAGKESHYPVCYRYRQDLLACALGIAANWNFYEVKYIRLLALPMEITIARGASTNREVMKRYKEVSLMILCEWLLHAPKESEIWNFWN